MEFFATCGTGLEAVLGDELRSAGVHGVRPLRGGVTFSGGLEDAYRALLWSRVANRVLLTLARVEAHDADELYEGVRGLDWTEHLRAGGTLAVDAHGANDALHDSRFTALKAKDAICDALRDATGSRPDVDAKSPDVRVNVNVSREKATLSIDLSGEPLERRGYRPRGAAVGVPVRENLAAALLLLAGFDGSEGQGVFDPLCGGGVLAVEAAMIACDVAPGATRTRWGFKGWAGHDGALWARLLEEADARAEEGIAHPVPVVAVDADASCLAYARSCAKRAGVEGAVSFFPDASHAPTLSELGVAHGAVCCAVPSELELSLAQLPAFFSSLSERAESDDGAAAVALLVPQEAEGLSGLGEPSARVLVKNGPQDAALLVCPRPERGAAPLAQVKGAQVRVSDAAAQQFASRLSKVEKQRRKWAAQNGVTSYRVYDADLPDYKLAIDVYGGAGPDEGSTKVHVAEYAAPKEIDPAKASRRLGDALRIIPEVFEVEPSDVYVKRRVHAKGGSQYAHSEGQAAEGRRFVIQENGFLFEVDLVSHLDTGIFLDHRDTRRMVGSIVRGKSFLNLFAYTGTASVYAAAGGASSTTTVDLSNTYIEWARCNMRRNGLLDERQHFERADALAWAKEARHARRTWDVVFVDVPTFSNSAKMRAKGFDVQRDHVELLIDVSRLLAPGGAAVFSCNLRSFEPDVEALAKAGVAIADVSAKTIPDDFSRNPRVHRCYLLKRR